MLYKHAERYAYELASMNETLCVMYSTRCGVVQWIGRPTPSQTWVHTQPKANASLVLVGYRNEIERNLRKQTLLVATYPSSGLQRLQGNDSEKTNRFRNVTSQPLRQNNTEIINAYSGLPTLPKVMYLFLTKL